MVIPAVVGPTALTNLTELPVVAPTGNAAPVAKAPVHRVVTSLTGIYKPDAGVSMTGAIGIVIFGKGGVGKTTLLGTMPGRGLVVDVPQIEGGTVVLSDMTERIDVKPCYTWNDIDQVYWYLKGQNHPYDWIAIDSITAFQELAKRRVVAERTLDADPHMQSLQEYGKMSSLLGDLIYNFRTLGTKGGAVKPLKATIWIAQERVHGNDNDPRITGPDLTRGSLAKLMPPMMLVGRMSTIDNIDGSVTRTLRIGSHPAYFTKARAKAGVAVVNIIAKPDLGVILRHLFGNGPAPEPAVEPIFQLA